MMKKITKLTKTLLVAAGLLVGTSAWAADTETVNVLSENYESYSAGDISATMTSNGWNFQSRNNKNDIKIVQGSGTNNTKYFDFYYPDGGASRNQSWDFGISSSLNADNWKLTFSAALNPGTGNSANVFYIVGTKTGKVTSANDALTNPLFKLNGTASAAATYIPTLGTTEYEQITLTSGAWYKFTVVATNIADDGSKATINVKITSYDEASTVFNQTIENLDLSAIGTLKGLCWNSPRAYSRLSLDDVLVTKEVDASICADPQYRITGPDGVSRKFELTCETVGSTIYYATSALEKEDAGWTEYTSEVTTDASSIYAYAKKGTASSEIINFATGAGTAITLNAPTFYVNNMVASGTLFNASFGAWYNTSGVEFTPDATLTATFTPDGGSESTVSLPYTVTEKGTLKVTATAAGFTPASSSIYTAAKYGQTWQSLDFSSLVGIEAVQAALGDDWTQQDGHGRWASWKDGSYNFYQHGSASAANITINSNIYMREVVLLAEGMGLGRNVTGGEAISVSNTSAGQIVRFEIYNGYGADINKGTNTYMSYALSDGESRPSMSSSNGALLVQATVYSPMVTVPCTNGFATYANHDVALDFTGVSGLTAYTATVAGDVVTFTPATKVPAGTGLLLKGATADVPVIASADAISENIFYAPITAVASLNYDQDGYYNYILTSVGGNVGFYRANNNSVAVGKAYLRIAKGTDARQFTFIGLDNDGETTGVADVKNVNSDNENFYNLNGQRIVAPQKGLYIVNGKKVIIK